MIWAAISDRIARSWTLLDFTEIRLGGKNFEVLLLSSFDRGEIRMGKIWNRVAFGGNSDRLFVEVCISNDFLTISLDYCEEQNCQ